MLRRSFLIGAGAVAAGASASARARTGPEWPTRAVKLVVPFPPGNTADIVARTLGEQLTPKLGQPVIVENKAGASGILATSAVARETDGHTFLLTTASPLVLNPAVYASLPYDVTRDFAPIAELGTISVMLVAHPAFPANSVSELIAYLKSRPGKLTYASVGPGTFTHLTMERFKQVAGVDLVHVPYRGAGAALTDIMGQRVDLMFDSFASSNPQVQAGTLKGLAMTSKARSVFAPNVPTLAESGLPEFADFEVEVWTGLLGPASTPPAHVSRLAALVSENLADETIRAKLAAQSVEPAQPGTPTAFERRIASDRLLWAGVARAANVSLIN